MIDLKGADPGVLISHLSDLLFLELTGASVDCQRERQCADSVPEPGPG